MYPAPRRWLFQNTVPRSCGNADVAAHGSGDDVIWFWACVWVCGAVLRIRGPVQCQSQLPFCNLEGVLWQLLGNSWGNRMGNLAGLVIDQGVQLGRPPHLAALLVQEFADAAAPLLRQRFTINQNGRWDATNCPRSTRHNSLSGTGRGHQDWVLGGSDDVHGISLFSAQAGENPKL